MEIKDSQNIDILIYQFKISVVLGETERALCLYQNIFNQIDQFYLDDIIILNQLAKNIIKNFRSQIEPLIQLKKQKDEENSKNQKLVPKNNNNKDKNINSLYNDLKSKSYLNKSYNKNNIFNNSYNDTYNNENILNSEVVSINNNNNINNNKNENDNNKNNNSKEEKEEEEINLLQIYIKHTLDKNIILIQQLMTCLDYVKSKLKDLTLLGIINKTLGKLYLTLFQYQDREKSSLLEKALRFYQKSIYIYLNQKNKILLKNDENNLVIWFKLVLSYCKFLVKGFKDYFRSGKKEKLKYLDKENMLIDLDKVLEKFENFRNQNLNNSDKVLKIYYPEYKNLKK